MLFSSSVTYGSELILILNYIMKSQLILNHKMLLADDHLKIHKQVNKTGSHHEHKTIKNYHTNPFFLAITEIFPPFFFLLRTTLPLILPAVSIG